MKRRRWRANWGEIVFGAILLWCACTLGSGAISRAAQKTEWTEREKPIFEGIEGLRALPDDVRGSKTKELAMQIRALPAAKSKVELANDLANLSTEGDFGRDALQAVADTLAAALREKPVITADGKPALPYMELAELARYEHVKAELSDPGFAAAMAALERADERRQHANFALADLNGKTWSLRELRGKVVVVNFWATWCPPCRKEMPDLETLYRRFSGQGLVILAISDEEAGKVKSFLADKNITYPVLLDSGRKVNELFEVQGIPKSFVYDREGKLVTESIDMRTQKQFLEMVAQAGLR